MGNNIIYDGILFDNLNYKIIDAKGIDFTDYKVANGAITFNQPDNEFDKLYLVYFNDNDELFRIDIRRSLMVVRVKVAILKVTIPLIFCLLMIPIGLKLIHL